MKFYNQDMLEFSVFPLNSFCVWQEKKVQRRVVLFLRSHIYVLGLLADGDFAQLYSPKVV